VAWTPLKLRSNKATPKDSSSRRNCLLTAGCEQPNLRAAAVTLPASAISANSTKAAGSGIPAGFGLLSSSSSAAEVDKPSGGKALGIELSITKWHEYYLFMACWNTHH
jgi:hypothetical protein